MLPQLKTQISHLNFKTFFLIYVIVYRHIYVHLLLKNKKYDDGIIIPIRKKFYFMLQKNGETDMYCFYLPLNYCIILDKYDYI